MIEVKVDNQAVLDALERLSKAAANPRPVLKTIGETLVKSTKARFASSTAPDGTRWAANSQVTYLQSLGSIKNHELKGRGNLKLNAGLINSKGSYAMMGKKPLIGESRDLSRQIDWQVSGDTLFVGSSVEKYATTQQFGAKQGEFGLDKRNHPLPWGDIPARPFLGVSDADSSEIVSIVSDYLRRTV
jgi:phage gpG-like protein